jgi:hypothetical protein
MEEPNMEIIKEMAKTGDILSKSQSETMILKGVETDKSS